MKKHAPTLLALAVVATLGLAGPIHTWSVGEVITSVDLNAALSHIHGTMVGGHGPRLTNSDVSGSAAIAHTKLASPILLPKLWAQIDCLTTPGTCTTYAGSGITTSYTSLGVYQVTFTTPRTNGVYGLSIASVSPSVLVACQGDTQDANSFVVKCSKSNPDAGPTDAPANGAFTFILFDDNN